MYGLIKCLLYDEKKQNAFESVYNNSSINTQLLIRSTIAEALKDCPRILESHGSDFILCTLASYHKNEEDTMRIYQSIMHMFSVISFGFLTEDIKFKEMNEVADSCLVGISFFRERMEWLNQRKAAPSVSYYKKMGAVAFHHLGYDAIGDDFNGWISFIEKELVL